MSRPPTDLPERLLEADATDFERRLLRAARQKGPPPATSARVAQALGLTVTVAAPVAAATTLHAGAAASKAAAAGTTAAGTTAVWPWVSAGALALAVVGAVVGTRAPSGAPPTPSVSVPRSPEAAPALPDHPTAPLDRPSAPIAGPGRSRPAPAAGDLGEQIALLDTARAAASAGAGRRALELLRRYEEKYPAGSFRPEAVALKVEVLVKLGRTDEARALAERFVTQHRGSLLARRVAELAGLAPSP